MARGGAATTLLVAIACCAALPLILAPHPPLYDYYQWMYQGHLVSRLLPWGPDDGGSVAATYSLVWGPTPNLGAVLGIGVLATAFPTPIAARVFALLTVLAFGAGFAFLTRSVQGRPTAVEMLGFGWAYGFLAYRGYLSNLLGLALALFALGALHRLTLKPGGPRRGELAGLAISGVVVYFCHLLGWAVFALGVAAHALALLRRGRSRAAAHLAATVLPVLALLGWFSSGEAGGSTREYYENLGEKLVALAAPVMPFLRTDPLPAPFSLFLCNSAGLAGIVALVGTNRRKEPGGWAGPMLATALALAAVAALLPFEEIVSAGASGRPDERLVFSALILALASIPLRKVTLPSLLAGALLCGAGLALHTIEYRQASAHLKQIHDATSRAVPAGRPTFNFVVWESTTTPCRDGPRLSFGVPALRWFDQERYLESGGVRSRIAETSLVRYKERRYPTVEHWSHTVRPKHVEGLFTIQTTWRSSPVVVAFGCEEEIASVRSLLEERFALVEAGRWFAVFRGPDVAGEFPVLTQRRPGDAR